ncbi:MAG: creatininase family protein, partial [Chloroflexi bacterium]|nr:creatininase family protein [Chloroflexota bacterium]
GDIDPPTVHMKYPGSISLTEKTFRALLRDICASFRTHGFEQIVLIGDSGGNQNGMKAVAAALDQEWAGGRTRVHYIAEYYDYPAVCKFLERNGIKLLAGGQTQGTSPLTHAVRKVIASGELGPLRAINVWAYTGWMLRPRMPQEVDESLGGGVVWRQAPHQIETVRYLGGGLVRSVRAMTGRWRPERPDGSGYYAAYLEFEDGTPVTLVYNAYGYFDSMDLVSWGEDKGHESRAKTRKAMLAGEVDEEAGKERTRFGSPGEGSIVGGRADRPWMPGNLGVFIVSCESGDIRMSAAGMYIYDNEGMRDVPVPQPGGAGMTLDSEVMELYDAIRSDKPLFHDGRWGMATAEVQWAIIESAKQRKEIMLKHQVPVPAGF